MAGEIVFIQMMITKSFARKLAVWFVITVAVLGVAADCTAEGGMYQGGGDSAPGWR